LSRVLLVYGTSSYNGFPYRHPFITLHEVIHENAEARLGEGNLVTPKMLADLMDGLGRKLPVEILPERVLVRTSDTIVWWAPARRRTMFFADRGGDSTLKKLNGRKYPQPPLLFKTTGRSLWVRALAGNERPTAASRLSIAPYWNCNDNGAVCTGSMMVPRDASVAVIDRWEQAFFGSEFTHAAGVAKHTSYPRGLLAMWQSLLGRDRFPNRYLISTRETVAEFVNSHVHPDQDPNHAE
jgi:PRTRC genetic system protein B